MSEVKGSSKRVIVTGCSSGFGYLTVQRLAEAGHQVLGTTRDTGSMNYNHPQLHLLEANVSTAEGRQRAVDFVQTQWQGWVDCLINNAGFGLSGPVETVTEEQIRQQMEVNFFAPLLLTREMLPFLRASKGRIINISSLMGYVGIPMQGIYTASKFAVEGLTESLYHELKPHGVQVALVEPGGFSTGFGKKRQLAPQDASTAGVYNEQMRCFLAFLAKASRRKKGGDPAIVADVITALVASNNLSLRIRVGVDAQALYYLRRLLPQRMADKALTLVFQQALKTR